MTGVHDSAISDERIRTVTGKDWTEWVAIIDAWPASRKSFVTIANYLMRHYGLRRLWAQTIAVYYGWGQRSK